MFSRKIYYALFVSLAFTMGYYAFRPTWHAWVLEQAEKLDVVVYCDTAAFKGQPVSAIVEYDAMALSPLCHVLGIFQDRPPERVRHTVIRKAAVEIYVEDSVWLRDVSRGPLTRITFIADDQRFHAPVYRKHVRDGKLRVWVTY